MAVGVIFQGPDVTEAQYHQERDQLETHVNPPPGRLWHAAGVHTHGLHVMEVWDSEESAQQFFDEKLSRAMQDANMTAERHVFPLIITLQP